MDAWFYMRRALRQMLPATLCACVAAYFAYHLVQGERGLIAHARLQEALTQAQVELASVQRARERLETRVELLHPDHVNRDMLDERARRLLGLVHPDEIVILRR